MSANLETFSVGQRWVSETEPELGLGSILSTTARTVSVHFGAADATREYALDNAPLRRVRFRVGDSISRRDGVPLKVEGVLERQGVLSYQGEGREVVETELGDLAFPPKPEQRLFAGFLDSSEDFELRTAALQHQFHRRKSRHRGFVGGRIQLIPHQLYIASEVSGRLVPRVLLADEVGLGKTIEACLILHRLILTGSVQRALILVPESLVHQWFVELQRRFNLWFHIFDEERCDAIETADPEANPFLDDQLVLASIKWLTANPPRLAQAMEAGWDILVVDEAHHLGYSPDSVSAEYRVVEGLSQRTAGLLLLTGTPEQLGMGSHFARLRLLDPDRFYDLKEFLREAEEYRDVAQLAEKLLSHQKLTESDFIDLSRIVVESVASLQAMRDPTTQHISDTTRDDWLEALLDRHGTGRVLLRNTRVTISGFPRRLAHLHPLQAPQAEAPAFASWAKEFSADASASPSDVDSFEPDYSKDIRLNWLAELLLDLGQEKVLLICRTKRKALAIDAALRMRLNVKQTVFHEGLSLVQRDRNAAWFAEEDGARLLIASEIGSEGRNFQFAHHLVLFDLPHDPEMLEQRIGRLDRIGQASEIQIHVPFIQGTGQEVLARWHHEAMNAFEKNLHGGRELWERFGARLHDLGQDFHETEPGSRTDLDALLKEGRAAREELASRLEHGRDRLLELNSYRAETGVKLVTTIREADAEETLDKFMLEVFDHYSIQVEEVSRRTYVLGSAGVFSDSFPGLPSTGLTVTCDRRTALEREDMQFLTWDHPLVTGALDLLLGSETGNSSFASWPDADTPGMYLETIHVLECPAPISLHVDRFLPPTPLRVVVDQLGNDVETEAPPALLARHVKPSESSWILEQPAVREELLPSLLERSAKIASLRAPGVVARARSSMSTQLTHEIHRLEELRKVNRSVRAEEIDLLRSQMRSLEDCLHHARVRLDALRVIWRGPIARPHGTAVQSRKTRRFPGGSS